MQLLSVLLAFAVMMAAGDGKKKKNRKPKKKPQHQEGQIVHPPAAVGALHGASVNSLTGDCVINGREFCAIVQCSTLTDFVKFVIDPSDVATWAQLAKVSERYGEYVLEDCWFEFLPTSSTERNGKTALVLQPNPDATQVPESFQQVEAWSCVVTGTPYSPLCLRIPKKYLGQRKFIGKPTSAIPSFTKSNYHCGMVYFMSSGGDEEVCGEVFVNYRIKLMNQFVANDDIPSWYVSSDGADPTNLLVDATEDVRNMSGPITLGDVSIADVVTPALIPVGEGEGYFRANMVGTGLSTSTAFALTPGTGELFSTSAATTYVNGTTKAEVPLALACLAGGEVDSELGVQDPIDWLIASVTGSTTLSQVILAFLPSFSSIIFDSLPVFALFKRTENPEALMAFWVARRKQRQSVRGCMFMGPMIRKAISYAKLGLRYTPQGLKCPFARARLMESMSLSQQRLFVQASPHPQQQNSQADDGGSQPVNKPPAQEVQRLRFEERLDKLISVLENPKPMTLTVPSLLPNSDGTAPSVEPWVQNSGMAFGTYVGLRQAYGEKDERTLAALKVLNETLNAQKTPTKFILPEITPT